MLTIVLSGPKAAESQVRNAFASQGFEVQRTVDNHGLPDSATEKDRDKKSKQPIAFVTVTAPDEQLNAVRECAETLSYRLRMHHDTPPEPAPDPLMATLEDMQREIDELKARVA
jgi:hypothetical protein